MSICVKFKVACALLLIFGAWHPAAVSRAGYSEFRMGAPAVVYRDDGTTKVSVKGNSVLVPVTLVHGSEEVEVELLLDTGATRTVISTDVADRLSINLGRERRTKVQIVGGAVIDAHLVRVKSLSVGPHAKRNWDVVVVPHNGPVVEHDGLLGMDVLRDLRYRVDFKRKLIVWN